MVETASELLPVLVSDLVDDEALDFLFGVALAGGVARIPLLSPPMDATDHVLEVYGSGSQPPLCLIAKPIGLPDAEGFPLELRLARSSVARTPARHSSSADLRPKRLTAPTLSKKHSRDLMGPSAVETARADGLIGRSISGGKLVIEELLGTGGMGAVYKARHSGLNRHVAVKVLHESFQHDVDFCKRFHAEALAASQLDHPNLTRVLDFGQETDGLLYIAMEFLRGTSLRAILDREGRIGAERAAKLMMQVLAGLLHVHARALVHRDIKPDNLIVLPSMDDDGDPTELVKVCDFGIAVGGSQENARLAGTPDYMSPEQCTGKGVDARSDVYACGVVLYELVTGTPLFTVEDPTAVMRSHVYDAPEPPSARANGVPPLLEQVILKALSKDPAARQESARELRRELRAVLETPKRTEGQGPVTKSAEPTSIKTPVARPADDVRDFAATLARDPGAYLARIAAAATDLKLAEVVAALDGAVPKLLERGEVATLVMLAAALDAIAAAPGPRAAVATSALKPFADPQMLVPIAELALTGEGEAASAAAQLLVRAGVGGSYALYTGRLKQQSSAARKRFRSVLQKIGVAALPVMRSALERIAVQLERGEPEQDGRGAQDLATDVLESLPPAEDDALGNIVSRYARAENAELAATATSALARLWGLRSRALLVALLQHPGEPVRLAATLALLELGAVDEHTVRKLGVLADDPATTSPALRAAVTRALVGADAEAKNAAANVMARSMSAWPDGPELVTLAEHLLALGGARAAPFVQKRAAATTAPLRDQLEALLTRAGH